MLGYGLLNSKIHEICITGIIRNFFARSLFIIPQYYSNLFEGKSSSDLIKFNDIKMLYNLFISEEQKISTIEDGVLEINKNIYKYILSANVIVEKNYRFREKQNSEIIENGKKNLESIFLQTFKKFFDEEKLKQIFMTYDLTSSLDDFNFKELVGIYFPELSTTESIIAAIGIALSPATFGTTAIISIAILTDYLIDELDLADNNDKVKLKKYKRLYEKLEKLHTAIRGPGTDEMAIINIIKNMSGEERCYICSRYQNYENGESMFAALESDLNDKISFLGIGIGEDSRKKYLYDPLNCKQFFYSETGGDEGSSYETIKNAGICKKYFSNTNKYKLRAKEIGMINTSDNPEENYKKLNLDISQFLIDEKNYVQENNIFNSCYKFFKDNNFFIPRDTYLRLLNEQIDALEV